MLAFVPLHLLQFCMIVLFFSDQSPGQDAVSSRHCIGCSIKERSDHDIGNPEVLGAEDVGFDARRGSPPLRARVRHQPQTSDHAL